MDKLITRDLERVPRDPASSPQSKYRMIYEIARLSSLGPKGLVRNSAEAVHEIALRTVRREYLDFAPLI